MAKLGGSKSPKTKIKVPSAKPKGGGLRGTRSGLTPDLGSLGLNPLIPGPSPSGPVTPSKKDVAKPPSIAKLRGK